MHVINLSGTLLLSKIHSAVCQIGFGVQSRSWPIYEMTYLCRKLSVNFAWMNSSQTPCGHPSDCGCQRAGEFGFFFYYYYYRT